MAPTPILPAFFSKQGLRHFYICWDVRLFLFVPSLLPTVMDPYSVIFRLIFFLYFYNTFSHCHAITKCLINLSAKWHGFQCHLWFPLQCITKLYKKGLMSANTISALFFLCTGYAVGETVVFCAGTCLCNISHEFLFTSLLPFSFSILLLH